MALPLALTEVFLSHNLAPWTTERVSLSGGYYPTFVSHVANVLGSAATSPAETQTTTGREVVGARRGRENTDCAGDADGGEMKIKIALSLARLQL